jgi:cystathionine gamma-synthase
VGGALVLADADIGQDVAFHQNAMGSICGPFDAWLVLRGIKTLGVRMDRHCANAAAVVDLLVDHPAVADVYYPGLPGHAGHAIAARQMSGFGGMVSFTMRGGEEAALKVCELVQLFTLGESLGGVESLIEHPGRMTHASVVGSPLAQALA